MKKTVIETHNLKKTFSVGTDKVEVLKDISFTVKEGDFLLIFGPSGSGKSTLLNVLLGLEEPTSGQILVDGKLLYHKSSLEDDRSIFRKKLMGVVFQRPNWVNCLTVVENVAFPLLLLGKSRKEVVKQSIEALNLVGLSEKADFFVSELSSGQQERVALARALINNPKLIIADEPTGNLDTKSGKQFMELLSSLNIQEGKTILMVSHDLKYLGFAKSAINIVDGQIADSFLTSDKAKLDFYRKVDL
jgi:putative ABC transport system ATP-binding protein